MNKVAVEFLSAGTTIRADLYTPAHGEGPFPVIVMAVIVYFHHAMKPETARLEPEQLLKNPWIVVWTVVTGAPIRAATSPSGSSSK